MLGLHMASRSYPAASHCTGSSQDFCLMLECGYRFDGVARRAPAAKSENKVPVYSIMQPIRPMGSWMDLDRKHVRATRMWPGCAECALLVIGRPTATNTTCVALSLPILQCLVSDQTKSPGISWPKPQASNLRQPHCNGMQLAVILPCAGCFTPLQGMGEEREAGCKGSREYLSHLPFPTCPLEREASKGEHLHTHCLPSDLRLRTRTVITWQGLLWQSQLIKGLVALHPARCA